MRIENYGLLMLSFNLKLTITGLLTAALMLCCIQNTSARDISEELKLHDELTEFADLLEKADLHEELTDGNFTIFAPTNEVVRQLPRQMTEDEQKLSDWLSRHIVNEKFNLKDLLQNGTVRSVNGQLLQVQHAGRSGEPMVSNAMIRKDVFELNDTAVYIITSAIAGYSKQICACVDQHPFPEKVSKTIVAQPHTGIRELPDPPTAPPR